MDFCNLHYCKCYKWGEISARQHDHTGKAYQVGTAASIWLIHLSLLRTCQEDGGHNHPKYTGLVRNPAWYSSAHDACYIESANCVSGAGAGDPVRFPKE